VAAVEPDQDGVDQEHDGGGDHDAHEYAGGVEVLARILDQVAEPLVADQELADDGGADGARQGDLERGEQVRQRARQADVPQDVALAGAQHAQYGFGVRYQIPITRAWLFRADATYQILAANDDFGDIFEGNFDDNFGIRAEMRRKF